MRIANIDREILHILKKRVNFDEISRKDVTYHNIEWI